VDTYVVRVWLPDRPGALGQVASRIGAVGGDVVGIEILERGADCAVDELVVNLPGSEHLDLLLAEIAEVDGVSIEECRRVDQRGEPVRSGLDIAVEIVEAHGDDVLSVLCHRLHTLLGCDWAAAVRLHPQARLVSVGHVPATEWLVAFVEGSRHHASVGSAPDDVAWTFVGDHDVVVAVGRRSTPFRARERSDIDLLGRVADGVLERLARRAGNAA
jgi:hypothetical protein